MSAVPTLNLSIVTRAREFATAKHHGQVRKYTGEPYVNHCASVARLVAERGGAPEVVAAALLHDTLEGTSTTYEELVENFGNRTAGLVLEVTDEFTKESYQHMNRAQRKNAEAARLAEISADAKLIKLCDLIDNTRSIVEHDPSFAVTYLREKAAALEAMGYGDAA